MQVIVAATDGSEGAERALNMASTLASACKAKLIVVTVEDRSLEKREGMRQFAQIEGGPGEVMEFVAQRALHRAREIAEWHGLGIIETQCQWGEPARRILETAAQSKAEIIVVGRRGHTRLGGFALGSVSQKLASSSACAVLVVP
jgi:nucleotide-binding universal stress UspA family protein